MPTRIPNDLRLHAAERAAAAVILGETLGGAMTTTIQHPPNHQLLRPGRRSPLDSNHGQLFRLRESTKGIYYHVTEAHMRAANIEGAVHPLHPLANRVTELTDLLSQAAQLMKDANDMSHQLGQEFAAENRCECGTGLSD